MFVTLLLTLEIRYRVLSFLKRLVLKLPFGKDLRKALQRLRVKRIRVSHNNLVEQLRQEDRIRVLFIVIFDSIWKYEEFYWLLEESKRFEPLIVVAPYTNLTEEGMIEQVNFIHEEFKRKGHRVESSYDSSKGWLDYKSIYKPHLVCFTAPYNYTINIYQHSWFKDVLTIYVPYAFVVIPKLELHYDMFFYNTLWKYFVESEVHKSFAKLYALIDVRHVIVSGYPGLDLLLKKGQTKGNVWKNKPSGRKKRIIWAPHHSIAGQGSGLDYSSFLHYHQFFLNLMDDYKGDLQVSFKPHPLLKGKLYKNDEWGKHRTDKYYDLWNNHPNGQLEEGAYLDLFQTSDALIHDSASFMAEYMVTEKPLLFLVADKAIPSRFNSYGKELFKRHYHSENPKEIRNFIDEVVFNEKDHMYNVRLEFIGKDLIPPNGQSAARNMFDHIQKELS